MVKLLNILFDNLRALQLLSCRIAAAFRAREISLLISCFVQYKVVSLALFRKGWVPIS